MLVESPSTPIPAPETGRVRRDWRPSQKAKGIVLAAGGATYALSHVLNLLASTPDMSSPLEIASKVLFGAGALLVMGGLGAIMAQMRRSALGVLAVQLVWVGMLFILLNAYSVLFIFPVYGWEGLGAIGEQAALLNLATIPTVILGPVLLGIAAWRHGAMASWNALLLIASAVAMGVMIAVPAWEAPIAIGSTIVAGIAYLVAGLRASTTEVER